MPVASPPLALPLGVGVWGIDPAPSPPGILRDSRCLRGWSTQSPGVAPAGGREGWEGMEGREGWEGMEGREGWDGREGMEGREGWDGREGGREGGEGWRGGMGGREGGTYSHVGASADEGIGHGVDELPTDTKVTQLDLSQRVDQDVGWLHIWGGRGQSGWAGPELTPTSVDDLVVLSQVLQSFQHLCEIGEGGV